MPPKKADPVSYQFYLYNPSLNLRIGNREMNTGYGKNFLESQR
jgi:hypothetical protein